MPEDGLVGPQVDAVVVGVRGRQQSLGRGQAQAVYPWAQPQHLCSTPSTLNHCGVVLQEGQVQVGSPAGAAPAARTAAQP